MNILPREFVGSTIKEDDIVNRPPPLRRIVGARSLPNNLASELVWPKDSIEQDFQVVAGGRIAMQVEGAGPLENAAQLYESLGHHHQVGHHIALAESGPQSRYKRCGWPADVSHDFVVGSLSFSRVP